MTWFTEPTPGKGGRPVKRPASKRNEKKPGIKKSKVVASTDDDESTSESSSEEPKGSGNESPEEDRNASESPSEKSKGPNKKKESTSKKRPASKKKEKKNGIKKGKVGESPDDDASTSELSDENEVSDHGLTDKHRYIAEEHLANIVVKLSTQFTYAERIALCDHYDKKSTGLPADQTAYECLMHRAHFVIRHSRKVCVL